MVPQRRCHFGLKMSRKCSTGNPLAIIQSRERTNRESGSGPGVFNISRASLVSSRAVMNLLNARRRRYYRARRPKTSHPSLSRNLIAGSGCPRFPLSGISRWRADQAVETKRALRQLVRIEYVPRKAGSSCQETVAFILPVRCRRRSGLSGASDGQRNSRARSIWLLTDASKLERGEEAWRTSRWTN